jgi:hypothetical protein
MRKYPFDAYTKVALPPAVADLEAPTLDELRAIVDDYYLDVYSDEYIGAFEWVYDIDCELTPGGLRLPKSTESVDATPWKGGLHQERPTRYGMTGASLEAFRYRPPDVEVLWHGARFKEQRVLIVRRGVPVETAWTAGDTVEVYRVTFGQRANADSSPDTATTFTVPLFVYAATDEAVLVA